MTGRMYQDTHFNLTALNGLPIEQLKVCVNPDDENICLVYLKAEGQPIFHFFLDVGIALVLIALRKNDNAGKYIAQFVMALLAVRWASIAFSTLTSDGGNLTKILPESIIMWLLIFLLWLGARKKEKK